MESAERLLALSRESRRSFRVKELSTRQHDPLVRRLTLYDLAMTESTPKNTDSNLYGTIRHNRNPIPQQNYEVYNSNESLHKEFRQEVHPETINAYDYNRRYPNNEYNPNRVGNYHTAQYDTQYGNHNINTHPRLSYRRSYISRENSLEEFRPETLPVIAPIERINSFLDSSVVVDTTLQLNTGYNIMDALQIRNQYTGFDKESAQLRHNQEEDQYYTADEFEDINNTTDKTKKKKRKKRRDSTKSKKTKEGNFFSRAINNLFYK
ncbi:hypothetical protein [Carp edema virus]|nr:hypothetical protein [Carp edema virus]